MSKKEIACKKAKQRRNELCAISKGLQAGVKEGFFSSVNEALIEMYNERTGGGEYKTFHDWRKDNKKVKKGSTSYMVWGSPLNIKSKNEPDETDEENKSILFPVCHLFHESQVE